MMDAAHLKCWYVLKNWAVKDNLVRKSLHATVNPAVKFFLRSRNTAVALAQIGDKMGANMQLKNNSKHL